VGTERQINPLPGGYGFHFQVDVRGMLAGYDETSIINLNVVNVVFYHGGSSMTANNQPILLRPATHVLAIVSLVLSILGMLPILPLVGSIGGIVTGIIARKEIRARADLYSGEGTARAGIILGWIGVSLIVLICVVGILGLAVFRISPQGMSTPIITYQPIPIQP
jgi:hypothetical protein